MNSVIALLSACVAMGLAPSQVPASTQRGAAPSGPAAKVASAPTVNVTTVVSQMLDRAVTLPGDLTAFQDVELRSRVAGFVEAITVDRGSLVKKGQLLA